MLRASSQDAVSFPLFASVGAVFALGAIGLFVAFPLSMFRQTDLGSVRGIAEEIAHSGVATFATVCAGQVGGVVLAGPLCRASVHPAGLLLRPLLLPSLALRFDEILDLKFNTRWLLTELELIHSSETVRNPVILRFYGSNTANRMRQLLRDRMRATT
jgi:hypothetical protein